MKYCLDGACVYVPHTLESRTLPLQASMKSAVHGSTCRSLCTNGRLKRMSWSNFTEMQKTVVSWRSPQAYVGAGTCGICVWVWTVKKDVLWVGVRVRPGIPSVMQMPSLMEAKFTIAVKEAATKEYTRKETLNFADGAALQPSNCNGSPRLLQVPASPTVRHNSNPPPTIMPDGKLQLQVTLEMMQ